MLGQRLRRWPNITASLFQRVVFAGIAALQRQTAASAYISSKQLLLFLFGR